MGGPSGEHAVSLKSGNGVAKALTQRGFVVEPVLIPQTLDLDAARAFTVAALKRTAPDVVFIALHGTFGEDGTIQQVCKELKLVHTGSTAAASRVGMDKVASRRRFETAGLAVPRWGLMNLSQPTPSLPAGISFPLVVKPVSQGSSLGVSIVQRKSGLSRALAEAGRYGSQVLVEQFVQGRELTVGILGEQPLPVIEIRPHLAFFDFTAKYTPGSTDYLVPAPLAPEVALVVQATAYAAHRTIGCRHLSRTDLILTPDGVPVVLEINTIPGFPPTSLLPKAAGCIGISYEELCERLVMMAAHRSSARPSARPAVGPRPLAVGPSVVPHRKGRRDVAPQRRAFDDATGSARGAPRAVVVA